MIGSDDIMIIDTQLSNNEHIVRTTQQWESSVVKYKIIPRGCLCVELTQDGKTRVKIGEGNKYYEQLPYVDADIDMEEITHIVEEYLQYYATTEYVDTKITTVDRKVDELDEDVTSLEETVNGYDERINTVETDVSNLNTQVTDISDTINTIDDEIDTLKKDSHTHDNKEILDNTTASFTSQDQTKLNGIEVHANNYSLPKATDSELGGIIVGDNLTITDGVLSANPGGYTLPPAKKTTLGGVIIGDGIDVDNTGKISVTGGGGGSEYVAGEGIRIDSNPSSNDEIVNTGVLDVTKNNNDDLVISKESGDTIIQLDHYTLPKATDSSLGGIIVGDRLSIDDGVLSADDQSYELPKANDSTLGGVIVGDGLSVDEDGTLSANEYIAGTGIAIQSVDTSEYVTSNEYYSIDVTGISTIGGRTYWLTTARAALPKYGFVAFNTKGTSGSTIWSGPILISKNAEAVRFTCSYGTVVARSLTYNNETWYYSEFSYWMPSTDVSGSLKKIDFNQEHVTESFIINYIHQFLDEIYNTSSHFIVNTGVLDVTKNSSGNLVISKESGDSTITLPQEYVLPKATSSTLGGVKVGDNINVDANGVISVDDPPAPYSLPIASDTTLGGIKVGNNLTIDSETGVLSADAQSITVDDELDDTSENSVQNKVLTPALESLSTMITKISKEKIDLWWNMEDNGS